MEHLTGTTSGAYYINEKIPFAINYVDSSYDVTHDNDGMGDHGSDVAGIATANRFIPAADGTYANALTEVCMQGVAPDAQVIVMKVFGSSGGAFESDYMVAIEDAILLGCDAANLSLGTDKGSGLLYVQDVDYGMVATPSTATNTMSVASADNVGFTNYYIGLGEEMLFYTESVFSDGSTLPPFTTVAGDVNYILIDGIGTAEEVAAAVDALGGTVPANTVFICARGEINFAAKATNAVYAGFNATIVYNNIDGALIMNMDGYERTAPAVSVSLQTGNKLREAAAALNNKDGNVVGYQGTMYISDKVLSSVNSEDYLMSAFSSWGVPGSLEMKPEITVPGGDIYSVNGMDPSGASYKNNSGTSMASPQIAGMAALVMQYIEETGLDEKLGISSRKLASSLLMSTAVPMKNGANYFPVLQQGAGLANVGSAIASNSYLWMDANANAGAADGKIKVELGDDPSRSGA